MQRKVNAETEEVTEAPVVEEQQELDLGEDSSSEDFDDEESDEKKDVPFWMKEEDEEEEEISESDQVPVSAIMKVKSKLKSKIQARDTEIERLKKENEQLKMAPAVAAPKRPKYTDFDTDADYEAAMDQYEEAKLNYQSNVISTRTQQSQVLEQRRRKVDQAVDEHYNRAAELVNAQKINPDVYKQADENVKKVIDSVLPKAGEQVFNEFINLVGEGSEKTMFYIGRNKGAQEEFRTILENDKTGLKAAYFLGSINEKISGMKNKSSRAPKPAARLPNGDVANSRSSSFKKKYDEAHKKGKVQEAYSLKKQARAAGVDTTKWR